MAFSLAYQKACLREKRISAFAQETVLSLTEPFVLKALYPLTGYTRKDETWGYRRSILPHQKKIHEGISPSGEDAKFILFNGGVGAGKTLCMCAEMLRYLKTYPGIKIVCTAPFDFFFVETVLPKWDEVFGSDDPAENPFLDYKNVKDRYYRMTNGSEIRFHAYDDPERVKGWEAHIIWIEEAAQMCHSNNELAKQLFVAFTQRLRAKPDSYPHKIYMTQNPSGHNWVWSLFIKSEPNAPQLNGDVGVPVWSADAHLQKNPRPLYKEWQKKNSQGDVYYTVSASSHANKHLHQSYIGSMLGSHAGHKGTIDRMIEGEFTPIMSMVYEPPIFSTDTHCIDYKAFMDYWEYDVICPSWLRVAVGIDCGGQRSPWAIEFYLQTEQNGIIPQHWVCFDEIYCIAKTWQEIIQLIKDKVEYHGIKSPEYWIDPISSNQRSGPTSITIAEEFANGGIATDFPKGYNKFGAIARVQDFLYRDHSIPCPYKEDERVIDDEGLGEYINGHSGLYYLSGVPERRLERNSLGEFINPEGYACPGNIDEKGRYRYDTTVIREGKGVEEGLPVELSQKIMDRSDHAQTAEMFWVLGINPFPPRDHKGGAHRKRPADTPSGTYGRYKSRRTG